MELLVASFNRSKTDTDSESIVGGEIIEWRATKGLILRKGLFIM